MNTIILPDGTKIEVADTNLVSDGYHTFGELYEHRCLLWAWIVSEIGGRSRTGFKTRKNDKGEEWEGWFIAGLHRPGGQITYHLPNSMWFLVDAPELERNVNYDGHTSDDVIRLIRTILKP